MRRFLRHLLESAEDRIFGDIPEDFHSVETGEAFDHCIECRNPLTGFYIIEKAYVRGDALYEYALCDSCMNALSEDLSEDSKKFIKKFLGIGLFRSGLDRCRKCKTPRDENEEHVICGAFQGDRMLLVGVPVSLCHRCTDELVDGLSPATRDRLDDFDRQHFPGPPEMELDLPRRRPVLI